MSKIVIDYDIRTTQAKREVEDMSRTVKREMETVEREAKEATVAVERVGRNTSTATASMSDRFRGAGEAISGVTASLNLMGVRGNAAIGTIGGAFASLAGGAGPLGLAIAGVTALVTVFSSLDDVAGEAETALDGITAALTRQSERLIELGAEYELLQRNILATPLRIRLEVEKQRLGELQTAAGARAGTEMGFSADGATLEDLIQGGAFSSRPRADTPEDRAVKAQAELIRGLERELDIVEKIRSQRDAMTTGRSGALRADGAFSNPFGAQPVFEDAAPPGFGTRMFLSELIDAENKARAQRVRNEAEAKRQLEERARQREAFFVEEERVRAEMDRAAAAEYDRQLREADKQRIRDMALERERVESSRLRIQASGERAAAIQATADAQARAYASSLSSVLADAALTGEFDQFAINLANVTTSALMDALASGVVQGLGVEQAAAKIFAGVAGAAAGGLGGAAAGPADDYLFNQGGLFDAVGSGPGKAGGDTVMFVMAPDQQMADSIVSKASANGMRAAVGRSAGRGIVAGTIPSRRR